VASQYIADEQLQVISWLSIWLQDVTCRSNGGILSPLVQVTYHISLFVHLLIQETHQEMR